MMRAPLVVVGLASAACSSPGQDLRARAAFDFACPANQLTFTPLSSDSKTQGVRGCGKQATYIYQGSGWMMNNTLTPGHVREWQP